MEIAILILAVGFFLFLYFMFSRVVRDMNEYYADIKLTLGELEKKLDEMENSIIKHYRPYSRGNL